jgi:hypothetical protein
MGRQKKYRIPVDVGVVVAETLEAGVVIDTAVAASRGAEVGIQAVIADAVQAVTARFHTDVDWPGVGATLKTALPDINLHVPQPGLVLLSGIAPEQRKDTAARVWRILGQLRRNGQLDCLPQVEFA